MDVHQGSTTTIKPNSLYAQELRETDVFIVDEISMVDNNALRLIDRMLKEFMNNKLPFGGKIFIIGGDFRQCLPVERRGSKAMQISKSVRKSPLWKHFKGNVFHLTGNKRVEEGQQEFADFILKMGDGILPTDENGYIDIPSEHIVKPQVVKAKYGKTEASRADKVDAARKQLIKEVFGPYIDSGDFGKMATRMILTPHNESMLEINNKIIDQLKLKKHEVFTKYSVDTVNEGEPDQNAEQWTPELIHSCNSAGLPPHELRLIKGMPVMVVRNLNPARGIMNGTRLTVLNVHEHILEGEILNGRHKGEKVMIPKVKLTSKDEFSFTLSRKQFPVKPCYAMTINKSKGQTIDYVGLDLTSPVFSHGQCYVAFSRVRGWNNIKVAVEPAKGNKVKNIVWKELLFDELDESEEMLPPATTPKTSRKRTE